MVDTTTPPESSILNAQTWISVCRAFCALDVDLQPQLFDLSPADYPVTQVYMWQKDNEDLYGSMEDKISLQEAALRLIGTSVALVPIQDSGILDSYVEFLITASEKSEYILFHAHANTQLSTEFFLRFSRRVWERHTYPARGFSLNNNLPTCSLLEALIKVSLCELVKVEESDRLRFDEPNALVESELLVRAACTLLHDLKADLAIDANTLASLYSNLVHVAQTPYERRALYGNIVVTTVTNEMAVTFSSPVPLVDYRATRKIFEMAGNDVSIVTDGIYVLGLRLSQKNPTSLVEKELEIQMSGHGDWSIFYMGRTLFKVTDGIPRLPRPRLAREELQGALKQFSVSSKDADTLWSVVDAATRAQHGAIVVISSAAINEAKRLRSQASLITPTTVPPEVISAFFAIDGAVLLGVDGRCHAVGVILDGTASERGTMSRGSRYNSSVRYIDSQAGTAIAIVVSEDKYVDLIVPGHIAPPA